MTTATAQTGLRPAPRKAQSVRRRARLTWVGLALGIGFWLTDSALHTGAQADVTFWSALLGDVETQELVTRVVSAVLLVAIGPLLDLLVRRERRALARELGRIDGLVGSVASELRARFGRDRGETASELIATALGSRELSSITKGIETLVEDMQRRFREVDALLTVTEQITSGLLLVEVFDRTYEAFDRVIPYDRLGVALVEPDGVTLRSVWARSRVNDVRLPVGYTAPLAGSSLQRVLETREPRILNDLSAYLAEHPRSESTALLVAEGIRSSLTCPLLVNGAPTGFLFFSSDEPDTYRDAHVSLFKLVANQLAVVVERAQMYERLLTEKRKSDELLLNVIPARIADQLRAGQTTVVERFDAVGVLFADVVGFTDLAGRVEPWALVGFLRDLFGRFDAICDRLDVEKIRTIGDGYIAVSGTPGHADTAALCQAALDMVAAARELVGPDGAPVGLRVGIAVGPVVAGVVAQRKFGYDIWGDAVNLAARVEGTCAPGEVHVTDDVRTRLDGAFLFDGPREVELKGKGRVALWRLAAAR